ncbi:unnamed protein product [Calypogeia fissa]
MGVPPTGFASTQPETDDMILEGRMYPLFEADAVQTMEVDRSATRDLAQIQATSPNINQIRNLLGGSTSQPSSAKYVITVEFPSEVLPIPSHLRVWIATATSAGGGDGPPSNEEMQGILLDGESVPRFWESPRTSLKDREESGLLPRWTDYSSASDSEVQ